MVKKQDVEVSSDLGSLLDQLSEVRKQEEQKKLGIMPKGQRESKAEKAARQARIDKTVADWKAKQNAMNITPVTKKQEQIATGQATGKGYIGGSGFKKGGLASMKTKPSVKRKGGLASKKK